jgi:hypothetical protein
MSSKASTSVCAPPPNPLPPLFLLILVTSCFMEVKNPYGLKNPVIQKSGGLTVVTQRFSWVFLLWSEVNQAPIDG